MDAFLAVSAESLYQERLREYTESLVRQGCTKPDWCVVALDAGVPVARAALWAMPGEAVPTDVVLIAADWSDESLSAGHALLGRVHELARAAGSDVLRHSVDNPPGAPQYQEDAEALTRLLAGSGYKLLRDGLRWRYSASSVQEAPSKHSLVFRALPEVGEDVFVDAIASTYEGTRDSWLTRNVEELGPRKAARADFVDLQSMEYLPQWWELAYTADGSLAGVIMAARNPGAAVIAYVGVVPEQRGRGLAPQLVRRGTGHLVSSGADEIRGDCDRDNVAMVKAFERAGYEEFARRRTHERALT